MKINLDRASNPDSHLKRYNLFKMIDKTEAVDADTVKIVLKAPFSAFVNNFGAPGGGDHLAGGAEAIRQGDRFPPGRHRAVSVRDTEPDRFRQGEEVRRLLAAGAAEA